MLVEDQPERPDARLARVVIKRLAKGVRVDDVALVRLVDGALQGLGPGDRDKVEERLNWLGEGNIQAGGDGLGGEARPAVAAQAGQPRFRGTPDADVYVVLVLLPEAPERRCAPVAQRRTWPASENRGHQASLATESAAAHRVDPGANRVQASPPDPMLDRLRSESEFK